MSSKTVVCPHCGGTDVDFDQARGNAVCESCGSVLEDNIIVSEVNFAENSLGGTSVIGQFVSSEGGKSHTLGGSFHHGFGKESRAITLQNGKRTIQGLGGQLKLNSHCIDTAYNFFKMAVSKKLTRGRKTTHIVAACLYLVCRTEGTPHMLLDFSDLLQVNVYTLGKVYLKLSQELHINVAAIDPCLYIARFAHKLEFGDKTHDVSMTALRLVSRMKRDWMHTGRRPSGLCGAALLVSARLHDFNRTQKEIIKVVKVCDATLRKRLTEFEETPSGKLTIEEFNRIDLEEEQDPPSFRQARRKAKLHQLQKEQMKLQDFAGEITSVQEEIEKALLRKKRGEDDDDAASMISDLSESFVLEESTPFRGIDEANVSKLDATPDQQTLEQAAHTSAAPSQVETPSTSREITDQLTDDSAAEDILESLLPTDISGDMLPKKGLGPSAMSLGLSSTIEECMQISTAKEVAEDDPELDLTGIDDGEIDAFILSDGEVAIKTEIWMKENHEYLQQQKEKEEREAKDREMGIIKPDQAKKKRKSQKRTPIQANTAGEAIEKLLVEKKISCKINYDVLRDLNKSKDEPVTPQRVPTEVVEESGPIRPITAKRSRPFLGSSKRDSYGLNKPKHVKIEEQPILKKEPKVEVKAIVESGPVQYDHHGMEDEQGDVEEDYVVEDTEEPLQSAAQLMGHTGIDDYNDYDDDMD
ncbi:transcription factor IIIB 90 kDa subunit-like [Antedon mediterranea]|uniref:transcription factor IIIB 90 kDa subunit-like n=1 Tax=Antedon mediterranea TaxID=105859 RepID=UPI003AF749F8